jgi:hypothetical protein
MAFNVLLCIKPYPEGWDRPKAYVRLAIRPSDHQRPAKERPDSCGLPQGALALDKRTRKHFVQRVETADETTA